MKNIIVLLIIIMLQTGCANQGQQARGEGAGAGALIGAGVVALLGAIIDDESGALVGAGIGALVGGAFGYSYANNVANRHKALAGKENDLDARIDFAKGINEDTATLNQHLADELSRLDPEVDKLVQRAEQQEITQKQLEGQREILDEKYLDTQKQLELALAQLAELQDFQASRPYQSSDLDNEIAQLQENVAQLEQNTEAFRTLSQRI